MFLEASPLPDSSRHRGFTKPSDTAGKMEGVKFMEMYMKVTNFATYPFYHVP